MMKRRSPLFLLALLYLTSSAFALVTPSAFSRPCLGRNGAAGCASGLNRNNCRSSSSLSLPSPSSLHLFKLPQTATTLKEAVAKLRVMAFVENNLKSKMSVSPRQY